MNELDRCWKNCLKMWKWIAKNWKKGDNVIAVKKEWLENNGFDANEIYSRCFFCNYCSGVCKHCPGVLTHPQFHCQNTSYDYYAKPKKFYAKLLHLDAKRKEAK